MILAFVAEAVAFAPALGSVLLIDQALKLALVATLPDGRTVRLGSLGLIRPTRRAGTLAGAMGLPRGLLPVLWVAILVVILLAAPLLFESRLAWVALGGALGGAAGNLLDLFFRGGVVDYVDLRVWPAFNLADVAIVIGVLGAFVAG